MDGEIVRFLQLTNYYMFHGGLSFITVEKAVMREEKRWRDSLGVAFNVLGDDAPCVEIIEAFGEANGYIYADYAQIQHDYFLSRPLETRYHIFCKTVARWETTPSPRMLKSVLKIIREIHDEQAFKDSMRTFAAITNSDS